MRHDFQRTDETAPLDETDVRMGCQPGTVWRVYACRHCGGKLLFIDGWIINQEWWDHFNQATPCEPKTIH